MLRVVELQRRVSGQPEVAVVDVDSDHKAARRDLLGKPAGHRPGPPPASRHRAPAESPSARSHNWQWKSKSASISCRHHNSISSTVPTSA